MTDTDDTLLDKIRRDIARVRESGAMPHVILPTDWIDAADVDDLIDIAAKRFNVPEDDVTFAMIDAAHRERLAH